MIIWFVFDKCKLFTLIYIILYSLIMVVVNNFVLILKIYATYSFWLFMLNLSGFDCFTHNFYDFNDDRVY